MGVLEPIKIDFAWNSFLVPGGTIPHAYGKLRLAGRRLAGRSRRRRRVLAGDGGNKFCNGLGRPCVAQRAGMRAEEQEFQGAGRQACDAAADADALATVAPVSIPVLGRHAQAQAIQKEESTRRRQADRAPRAEN